MALIESIGPSATTTVEASFRVWASERTGVDVESRSFNSNAGIRAGLAAWQPERVSDHLEARFADDVSLDELSRLEDLSADQRCRTFNRSTGVPPHRWKLARRIERAREIQEATDLSATEIAAAVGYDDPGQFSTAFRKQLQAAPSQYWREQQT